MRSTHNGFAKPAIVLRRSIAYLGFAGNACANTNRKDHHMTTITMKNFAAAETPFARISGLFAAWKDARATRRELNRLSERELEDIGMNRADIDTVTAWH